MDLSTHRILIEFVFLTCVFNMFLTCQLPNRPSSELTGKLSGTVHAKVLDCMFFSQRFGIQQKMQKLTSGHFESNFNFPLFGDSAKNAETHQWRLKSNVSFSFIWSWFGASSSVHPMLDATQGGAEIERK